MKGLDEFIYERLKITKDSKMKKQLSSELSLDDMKENREFKCITINLKGKNQLYKTTKKDDLPKMSIWVITEEPKLKRNSNDIYSIKFNWKNYTVKDHKCYTIPSINSPFMWFIHESGTPMYVIFDNDNELNSFIENYDHEYLDKVKDIHEQYNIMIKK